MTLVGRTLGRYHLVAPLGSGGMGAVFRATTDEGSDAAVKILHPHLLTVKGAFERFAREAELGRSIRHANVVRTLASGGAFIDGQDVHYLVMEYVEGQTLQDLLLDLEHVPEELCRHVGIQVARALAAIHALGAIHRDLKPANVIVTPDHEVKVMDFGVAHLADEVRRLSTTGDFVGSVLYAAPEQWDAKATVDGRADLFTLGIVLYELATGRHPFAGHRGSVPLSALARVKAEPASATRPELTPFFVELVDTLLRVDPLERFASADRLERVLTEGEGSAWWEERSRAPALAAGARVRRLDVAREARVVGRTVELDRLREALSSACEGRGQVVLLEGESGIGKTRLVDEFVRLEGDAFDLLFGSYAPGEAPTASGGLSTAFREHLGTTQLTRRLEELLPDMPGVVAPFADLLRGESLAPDVNRLASDALAAAFVETARALARSRPLVLFLDNLDFAPRNAWTVFEAMARALREAPVLLIGAVRPGSGDEALLRVQTLDHAVRIVLPRLGPQDLTALLTDALGSQSVAQHLGWEIARKSDGNPFYVFEILRDLRERKRLVQDDSGSWRTTGLIRVIDTPHSIRELLRARWKHLEAEDRDLLDLASCCGPRFDPALVAEAAGVALVPALKRFRRLERDHGLIHPDGRSYVFDHHQMQEALYEDLFEQLREQYHLAIAEASERRWEEPSDPERILLTRHFLYGGAPERARPHLVPALRALGRGHVFDQQGELARMALAAKAPLEVRERSLVVACLYESAEAVGDVATQEAVASELLAMAETLGDPALRLQALLRVAQNKYTVAELHEGVRVYEEARGLAVELEDRSQEEQAERGLGICWSRIGDREKALAHHLRSLELCEAIGADARAAGAHANVAVQQVNMGRVPEAEAHYVRAMELARATGHLRWEASVTANYGRIFYQRGDFAKAWEYAVRYRELTRRIGDRRGETTAGVILSALWMLFGALEEIELEMTRATAEVAATGDRWVEAHVIQKRAWLAEQHGDLEEARRLALEGLELRQAMGDREGRAVLLLHLGVLAVAQEDVKEAARVLEEALSIEEAEPETRMSVLCELAVVQPERYEDALRTLEDGGTWGLSGAYGLHCMWRLTGERPFLERARACLEEVMARVPEAYRDSARTRVRRNRILLKDCERVLG